MPDIRPRTHPETSGHPGPGLRGRRSECDVLDRLIESVRAGDSRTLVVVRSGSVKRTATAIGEGSMAAIPHCRYLLERPPLRYDLFTSRREGAATMTVGAVTADGRARVLADGNQMPMLGLGVWQVPSGAEAVNAVRWALELGYRHIDTAQAYGNEESVGRALRDSGVPRGEVFMTTKFYPGGKDPVAEAERSLKRLGVDQVDLYLVHWPRGGPLRAWPGMERARERGLARSVGVFDLGAGELAEVIASGTIPPAVNQVQFQRGAVPPGAAGRLPAAERRPGCLQPPGDRPAPGQRDREPGRAAGRADACAGAVALVPAA
jgi:hypothetical protein